MTHPVLIDSLLERYEFPPHDGSPGVLNHRSRESLYERSVHPAGSTLRWRTFLQDQRLPVSYDALCSWWWGSRPDEVSL